MAQVIVTAEREVAGAHQQVRAALADYAQTRPKILTDQFSDYQVLEGGNGAGSKVHWKFAATSKRVRDQLVEVSEPSDGSIVEADTNSSMVTTWKVADAGEGRSLVSVRTTWDGAGGIGGFFERTFAPKGLRRVYDEMIGKLDALV
ncbi:MAG TPA: SRPBCC family protein [Pseudonocardia sp.]|nr:SRPBCC family protein [Pseudonocardia sp.]